MNKEADDVPKARPEQKEGNAQRWMIIALEILFLLVIVVFALK